MGKIVNKTWTDPDYFEIIYEDVDVLVINKPAGLVCHPTKGDEFSSLISRVRLYLGNGKPAHFVNRLDRETSGAIMVAKHAESAKELGHLWENRAVEKEYVAIVHGHVPDETGLIDAPLGKDETSQVAIKDCVRSDGSPAQTKFSIERRLCRSLRGEEKIVKTVLPHADSAIGDRFTVLRVYPRTGRKHQIRIHLSYIGHPIIGDKIYGGDEDLYLAMVQGRLTEAQRQKLILPHHALHAEVIRFEWHGTKFEFRCSPEPWFLQFSDDI